jgi:predicted phosphoribosyltransferase
MVNRHDKRSREVSCKLPDQRFLNRRDAGAKLAGKLSPYAGRSDVVVLALPRGGVPVAYEVAVALRAPLDVFEVRKLGVPSHDELAMGAIGSGGAYWLNNNVIDALNIPREAILRVVAQEQQELERREKVYRDNRPRPEVKGKIVLLIDDGLATGASMLAAIAALRRKEPERIVVAVPVAPPDTCAALRERADDVVCLLTPEPVSGVGVWYDNFAQLSDDGVCTLLKRAAERKQVS